MKLLGMMDSPYTRRVAISMAYYQIKFVSLQISVFSAYEEFAKLSPVVKAPTLIFDSGATMLDSANILTYLEQTSKNGIKLMPSDPDNLRKAHILLGIVMTACDKAVQVIYEHKTRPAEKLYEPWLERITGQLNNALQIWEDEIKVYDVAPKKIDQVAITNAVVWTFIQSMLADIVPQDLYPSIHSKAKLVDSLPEFKKYMW